MDKNIIKNYTLFLIGLFIASLGVALSTKAGLGTSPVSCIPYSISLLSSALSFGGWLNIFSMIQIAIQLLLLKKNCNAVEIIIQIIIAFVYGYLTNFSCFLIHNLVVNTYPEQIIWLLISCLVLGLGIWIQLKGQVAMLPGEAMNRAISMVTGKKYENVKIFFDILYILISALIGIYLLGGLKGVREGSIISALLIGNIIKLYHKMWNGISKYKRIVRPANNTPPRPYLQSP
ncbi:MAG: DUF6198 family protein [Roseburia sp.]|nr:DUF6198 family protein [Roseburia sp.]